MGQYADAKAVQDRRLPVVIAGETRQGRSSEAQAPGSAGRAGTFDAHLLGQSGRKRGLKAGPSAIDAARSAYLSAEWSGEADRRLPAGLMTRTAV